MLSRTSWRVEIYLPTGSNPDAKGRRKRVEHEKFVLPEDELLERFTGTTRIGRVSLPVITGLWQHRGKICEDEIVIFLSYIPPARAIYNFLKRYKKTLEERFQQIAVLILRVRH